ncbi:tRNA (adenosine(37)-N6)-threonylcarbamoyltransferase complex dimerization subunit type 1 TsaB [Turicibacter sp. TJ11]|uniref:tRNA (adenosine(37)-N6)-threonylcarbamoyltransferase complex dimerization subunit type 1 TsaB n=1 Tax=Turicibacter sp. TJ11 TaxID=2806443 RepID=UPI001F19DC93|nr:tRNA (adenosine(37)-N6)-threonylcarbamoyltransferase complex dimerization subunit type 1 TsaB [Turicibacter sp. TJ11]
MFVLAIDTSNTTLSVALVENHQTLAEVMETTKNDHSKRLMPTIEALFKQINRTPKELDLIAVAQGPGSYTGVRIGVTVAKVLAWTLNKPLVGVSSLEILARNLKTEGYIIPLFDARRQTVFAGVYNGESSEVIVPDGHYELTDLLNNLSNSDKKMYFLGNDVVKYEALIKSVLGDRVVEIDDESLHVPHASTLANIALEKEAVENVHHFTPKYHRLPEAEMNWMLEQENKGK